jgi:hypothetical protein
MRDICSMLWVVRLETSANSPNGRQAGLNFQRESRGSLTFLEKTWELSHSSRNSVHPTDLLLFVTLFWCKTGLSEGLISSFLAPVHQRDVIHFVLQTLHACGPALRREIQFPDPAEQERLVEEFNKMHSAQFAGFTAAVDGTETKVRRGYELPEEGQSKGPRENEYSVKKKQPSICWTVIVLLNGIIVKLSKATWNHNDQAQWNSEIMRRWCLVPLIF